MEGRKAMSNFAQPRGGTKQIGIVVALSLVLVTCVGTLIWLIWSAPADLPASTSEGQSSSEPASSSSRPVSGSADPSASASRSGESAAPSTAAPPAPTTPPRVSTNAGAPAQKLQNLTINAALTHDENATYYNIVINAGGVTLKNKLVAGDLVLSESVGNGAVTLQNVVVKGRILVKGAQTVTLRDVTAVQLVAQRASGTTDYIIGGASTIHGMTAQNQLTLDQGGLSSNYAGVKKLTTERGTPMWQQVALLKGGLEQVITNDATNLLLSGGSSIGSVLANAPTHIGGTGLVQSLTVRSDEVSYEKKPRDVKLEGGHGEPNEQSLSIGEVGREPGSGGGAHSGTTTRKLATPKNLSMAAAADANSVTLAFDPVANATGYTVIYSVTNGSDALNVTDQQRLTDANSCTIDHALIGQEGTRISFRVRATSSAGRYNASDYSGSYTKTVTALGAPTDVRLTLNGNKLRLSFTPAANAAAGGHEAVLSVDGAAVATQPLGFGVTTCDFADLTAGKRHTVTVRAVGDGRLTLSSAGVTADYDVPPLPSVRSLAITDSGGGLTVTFTGAAGVSDYDVTLRYDGGALSRRSYSVIGDAYTYLFEPPAAIAEDGRYTASVTPRDGLTSTESRAVQRRAKPGNPGITSAAPGEITFGFDRQAGRDYQVVSATHTTGSGITPLAGITASNLTATGLSPAEGDTFDFSVKTLGDGLFYADSEVASAPQARVRKLAEPISPFFSGDQSNLTLNFSTTNGENTHYIAVRTSTDGGLSWSAPVPQTVAVGLTSGSFPTPGSGAQIQFSVTAKASNALQIDSDTVESSALSVVQLDSATGLAVNHLDTDSGRYAQFSFDAVEDATRYTVDYEWDDGSGTTTVDASDGRITTDRVKLSDGATVTGFTVTAHAVSDAAHLYLDSTASY